MKSNNEAESSDLISQKAIKQAELKDSSKSPVISSLKVNMYILGGGGRFK